MMRAKRRALSLDRSTPLHEPGGMDAAIAGLVRLGR